VKVEPAIIAIWPILSRIGIEIPLVLVAVVQQWVRQKSLSKVRVLEAN